MSEYFMLTCLSPPEGYNATTAYRDRRSWNTGERFEDLPTQPLVARLVMKPQSVIPELADLALPFMSRRLHETLCAAGIDNLDVFLLRLVDSKTGDLLSSDHLAFNLIGTGSVMDRSKSVFDQTRGEPIIASNIDSLVIDAGRARGALMFRLAEAVNGIVVHRTIKDAVERAGITTLTFIEPDQWAG